MGLDPLGPAPNIVHTPEQIQCSGVSGFRPGTSKFPGVSVSELGATFKLSVDVSQRNQVG